MSITIKAEKRDVFGKNANRRLRKVGKIPAILYGEGAASQALALEKKDVVAILKSETGENTIFKVEFDSMVRDAMFKDLQIEPTSDILLTPTSSESPWTRPSGWRCSRMSSSTRGGP